MLAQKVERLSFRVEWYDSVQELSYELVLRAYADGDVELVRRLERCSTFEID